MTEPAFTHTHTGLALQLSMDHIGTSIPKSHGSGITDYVQSLGRTYSATLTHAQDTGIDETDPEALGINILSVEETVSEVPWESPQVVSNSEDVAAGVAHTLDAELPFTKFLQPSIRGTQDTLKIVGEASPFTLASDAAIDESFRKTNIKKGVLLGGVLTIYNFQPKSQLLAAAQFTIVFAGAASYASGVYKLDNIRQGYDPANPDRTEWTMSRFTPNTEEDVAGPVGHIAHMIDILAATHAVPVEDTSGGTPAKADIRLGLTSDWTTTGNESEIGSAAALTATSCYLVSRTRVLSAAGASRESYTVTVWPTGDCVDPA